MKAKPYLCLIIALSLIQTTGILSCKVKKDPIISEFIYEGILKKFTSDNYFSLEEANNKMIIKLINDHHLTGCNFFALQTQADLQNKYFDETSFFNNEEKAYKIKNIYLYISQVCSEGNSVTLHASFKKGSTTLTYKFEFDVLEKKVISSKFLNPIIE